MFLLSTNQIIYPNSIATIGIKLIGELTPRTLDTLVSFGERLAVRLVAATLNKYNIPSQYFDSWTIGMRTTSEFTNAEVKDETYGLMREKLNKLDNSIVPVITGFIGESLLFIIDLLVTEGLVGHDENGRITTLGRGGSDLTATVVGAAVPVDEIQVWKDVDGIMTGDPRLISDARPVQHITYEEAAELGNDHLLLVLKSFYLY